MTPVKPPGQPRKTAPDRGPAAPRPWWNKGRPGRLTTGLVGLSSAAIVSVYAVGYFNTQPADGYRVAAQALPSPTSTPAAVRGVQAPPVSPTTTLPRSTPAGGLQRPAATPTPVPAAPGQSVQGASYQDGTYVGIGNSRHGSIQATVVVSGGKIVSAAITGCGTRYPCSKVSTLPGEVVARQGPPVNYISGATDSSQAYTSAVANALARAHSA